MSMSSAIFLLDEQFLFWFYIIVVSKAKQTLEC